MTDSRFYDNKGPFTVKEILSFDDMELIDNSKLKEKILGLSSMELAKDTELCYFNDRNLLSQISQSKAKLFITTKEFADKMPNDKIVLISKNPRLSYAKIARKFYPYGVETPKISDKASISKKAKIGKNCSIGDFVVIEDDVEIGDNSIIGHNTVIRKAVKIGAFTDIGSNATLSHCVIGTNCYIYDGVRIGQEGFGLVMQASGHYRIKQLGRVIIGNDVEIGANSAVDRGAVNDTKIGDFTKIDNMVHIAHNVEIGRGCIIIAQVGVAGSSTLGDFVVLAGQVGVSDHINIGSGAKIAAQSGVVKDVEAGASMMGMPAQPSKEFIRQSLLLKKLIKK